MSLFIGKDANSKNILHITKGYTDLPTISNGSVLSNTVFNTGLPLSSYKLIPVTHTLFRPYYQVYGYNSSFSYVMMYTWLLGSGSTDYGGYGFIPALGIHQYSMSTSDYTELINTFNTNPGNILCLDANYKILPNTGVNNMVSLTSYTSSYGQKYSEFPSTSYGFGMVDFQYCETSIMSYILIVKDNYYPALTGELFINNQSIYIGGTNIFQSKDIITSSASAGAIQVTSNLNLLSLPTYDGIGLSLQALDNNVVIKLANNEVFNSLYNNYTPIKSVNKSASVSMQYGAGSTYDSLLYTFLDNEEYAVASYTTFYVFRGEVITKGIVTKNSNKLFVVDIQKNSLANGWVYVDFLFIYSINNNIYLRSYRSAGGGSMNVTRTINLKVY